MSSTTRRQSSSRSRTADASRSHASRRSNGSSASSKKTRSRAQSSERRSKGSSERKTPSLHVVGGRALDSRSSSSQKTRTKSTGAEAREQKRRQRNKRRADKMFDRQMALSERNRNEEGAPRAALYKEKLTSAQRKTTRMQRASQAGPVSAKIDPSGWFSNINITPGKAKIFTALLCVVLVCAFLYTPAQQYYQSLRERDRLEAEYAAIAARNEALDYQNDSLASDAGMEDAVREKYGYVVEGEQTAKVAGLSETTTSRAGNENIEANVLSSTVKAPEEWYTPFLDALFGVQ